MPAEIRELAAFQCAAKHLSYARAAEELRLSPSGVSRLVSRLEAHLGTKLFQRTTRRISLSSAGAAFYHRTSHLLGDLQAAEAFLTKTAREPTGRLRLGAPAPFGQSYLAPLLGPLLARYPLLEVELLLQDGLNDLVGEGLDLAIRIGNLQSSDLVSRRLCTNRRILVASPRYLKRQGVPRTPQDLITHSCLQPSYFPRGGEWRLIGPEGPITIRVQGGFASNNIQVLISAALDGEGISVGPTQSVASSLLQGTLVRVLPEYEFERSGIYALYPSRRQLSSKVRATIDFFSEHFKDPPSWDLSLEGVDGKVLCPASGSKG